MNKIQEYVQKHAVLGPEEYNIFNNKFLLFFIVFFTVIFFSMTIYFGYFENEALFNPYIDYMKDNYVFFNNRYEDAEIAMPGAGLTYFLSLFFGVPIALLTIIVFSIIYIIRSPRYEYKRVRKETIILMIIFLIIFYFPVHLSYIERIDFSNPLKKRTSLYLGFSQVFVSYISIMFYAFGLLYLIVVIVKIIRQRGRLTNGW